MTASDQQSPREGKIKPELDGHFYSDRLRIRFTGDLERRYRSYCGRVDRRYVRYLSNILILLYIGYGFFDWFMLGEDVMPVWGIRYGLGVPGLILAWWVTRRRRAENYIEALIVACLFWLTVTTLYMVRLVPPDTMDLYLSSVLVIMMAGMTITRLRFWYAVTAGLLFLLSEAVLLPGVHVNSHYIVYYMVLSVGMVGFCLGAQYRTDRARRREFLQRILIHRKNQQLRRLNLSLQNMAQQDGLTGIANRRHFDMVLTDELRRARRRGYSVALLMCDIDFFKPYNDLLGHVQGDVCLKQVAQLIQSQVHRPGDLVARYGGEEFAVILPALDVREAQQLAQLICERVAAEAIPHPGSKVAGHITISIGVSALIPRDEDSRKQLISQADEALYQAKHQGRNCVRVHKDALQQVTLPE